MANVALLFIVLSLRVLVAFVPPQPWLGRTVDSSRRSVSTSKAPPVDSSSEEVDITGGDKVGQLGRPHTESSRAKISAANKGKVPWNVGKSHSEETRLLIAEKTREAMLRRKSLKLQELGLTQEDYDLQRLQQKKEKKRSTVKGGLTEEGRRRISESVKERWKDPEYRAKYTVANKGARNHSEATRARISEAITLKWQQPEYREKVKSKPTEEVRARISHTLKNKWQQQDFRDRMLAQQFPRTEEWKNKLSESIKNKWQDPEYRASVTSGIRSSNKTLVRRPFDPSRPPRPRRPSSSSTRLPRAPRMTAEERRARRKQERQERQEKERVRKAAFKLAKEDQKKSGGASRLKELLGRELWFEEKVSPSLLLSPVSLPSFLPSTTLTTLPPKPLMRR
jgi:hypothetical protein